VIEFGAPLELLCIIPDENAKTIDRNTMFSQMVLQNMEHEVQQIFTIAKETYLAKGSNFNIE
jgi:hypothetical protein